ncbi:MAG: DedA family protein [Planctomycetes bacterium]|nr:DedA family protein [Planctomycetota bacterium]
MEWMAWLWDFIIHLNKHLNEMVANYGLWSYLILFTIVFCETGLVVTPFLPGDSLLFAVGALAAGEGSVLSPHLCLLLLGLAAVLGDTANYWIGVLVGPKAYEAGRFRFIKKEHLERTHAFYEKHGGKTIILARFVPIIRTFAPFVAGIGRMSYGRFIAYNVVGGFLWPALFIYGGLLFGNIPQVKDNFSLVILGIIVVSVLPMAFEILRNWKKAPQPNP